MCREEILKLSHIEVREHLAAVELQGGGLARPGDLDHAGLGGLVGQHIQLLVAVAQSHQPIHGVDTPRTQNLAI